MAIRVSGTWRVVDPPDPWDIPGTHPSKQPGELCMSVYGRNVLCRCSHSHTPLGKVNLFLGGWQYLTNLCIGTGGVRQHTLHPITASTPSELPNQQRAYVALDTNESVDIDVRAEIQDTIGKYECPVPLLTLVVLSVRNISSDEDAHRLFNENPWPPDSMHGTSVVEAARIVIPLTKERITGRFDLKQVEFVGSKNEPTRIQIISNFANNGAVEVDLKVTSSVPWRDGYDAWLREETDFWKARVWQAYDAVTAQLFEPEYLLSYRSVAIPSWPIPLLPPELWNLYPSPSLMPPARDEHLAFLDTMLDIGVRIAGTLYAKSDWVSKGLVPDELARIVGRQLASTSDMLSLEFVAFLEAIMQASTLMCVPVTPYISEAMREHYACLTVVSADCEDDGHYISVFMLSVLLRDTPVHVLAGRPHLVAISWLLRTLYWPAQIFYETTAANLDAAGNRSEQGMAHQAAMLLPVPFLANGVASSMPDAPRHLREFKTSTPSMLIRKEEMQAMGIPAMPAKWPPWCMRPDGTTALPCIDGEGTGKSMAIGVPLVSFCDVDTSTLESIRRRLGDMNEVLEQLGCTSFFPRVMTENVLDASGRMQVPDSFKKNATVICLSGQSALYGIEGMVPVQGVWVTQTGTAGVEYTNLIAAPHRANHGLQIVQVSPLISDTPSYAERAQAALAATMLSTDRPFLIPPAASTVVPGLPAYLDTSTAWEDVLLGEKDAVPSHGCCVVPIRYSEGVLRRMWAFSPREGKAFVARVSLCHIHSILWQTNKGDSVLLLFVEDVRGKE